jgi:hypothetical protein
LLDRAVGTTVLKMDRVIHSIDRSHVNHAQEEPREQPCVLAAIED